MARVRNLTDRGVLPGGKGKGSFYLPMSVHYIRTNLLGRSTFTPISLGGQESTNCLGVPAGLGFVLLVGLRANRIFRSVSLRQGTFSPG